MIHQRFKPESQQCAHFPGELRITLLLPLLHLMEERECLQPS
jgi:hypothetical protein